MGALVSTHLWVWFWGGAFVTKSTVGKSYIYVASFVSPQSEYYSCSSFSIRYNVSERQLCVWLLEISHRQCHQMVRIDKYREHFPSPSSYATSFPPMKTLPCVPPIHHSRPTAKSKPPEMSRWQFPQSFRLQQLRIDPIPQPICFSEPLL